MFVLGDGILIVYYSSTTLRQSIFVQFVTFKISIVIIHLKCITLKVGTDSEMTKTKTITLNDGVDNPTQ